MESKRDFLKIMYGELDTDSPKEDNLVTPITLYDLTYELFWHYITCSGHKKTKPRIHQFNNLRIESAA